MQKPLDMSLVQRGARLKRSPYFEATQRYGCWGYTVYNHMFLPIGYDDLEREYEKLLNDVTVWDVSVERNTEIAGPDAFRFMSLLTPRDMSKCRGRPRQVRAAHRRRRRHRQRSGAAAARGEPLLARRRRQRRHAVGERRRLPQRDERRDPRARRGADADPGAEIARSRAGPLRRSREEALATTNSSRAKLGDDPGDRHAHRLDRRAGLRALSARSRAGGDAVGSRHGSGQALRHRADRACRTSGASKPASSTTAST